MPDASQPHPAPSAGNGSPHSLWVEDNPLRHYRRSQGLSLMAVAARLSVSRSTVQLWEGGGSTPTRRHLDAIAQLLNIKPDMLASTWSVWQTQCPS